MRGLLVLIVGMCVAAQAYAVQQQRRPFRAGVIKMAPELDKTKPLAMADASGWVLAGDLLVGAPSDDWVGAYSLVDRKFVWWIKTSSRLSAPISIHGSWVVLGLRDGRILKVEALTGKKIWEVNLDSYSTRPIAQSGAFLIALTAGQQLYALDYQTGATIWLYDAGFPDGLTLQGESAPTVQGDRIYIGLANGEIEAVNLSSGKLYWRYNPEYIDARFHDVVGDLVVANNRLIVARHDGLVAAVDLSDSDRATVWKDTVSAITAATFRNGRFFVGCINGDVYAYDTAVGRRAWKSSTGQAVTSITAGEAELYLSGSNGRITALDASTGNEAWHDDVGGKVQGKPVLYRDTLMFETGLKNLYGYLVR